MDLEIKTAEPTDLPLVLAILNELSAWGISKGIDMHWPESWPEDFISAKVNAGEMFLAYLDGEPVATLALQWSDEEAWGDQPPDAGYIHHLAVRRSGAGQGIGRKLLDWAADRAVKQGKRYLRLDCLASNSTLRQYYQDAGFRLVGTNNIVHDRGEVCLFEKKLG